MTQARPAIYRHLDQRVSTLLLHATPGQVRTEVAHVIGTVGRIPVTARRVDEIIRDFDLARAAAKNL
jgi:hypothetical protein